MAKNSQLTQQLAEAGITFETPEIVVPETGHIETVAEDPDFRVAREEAFMNQILKIRLATTTDPNAPPFATVTVNNPQNRVQIPRGVVVGIKRQHVEVLARMRETRFTQPPRNMMDPESGNNIIPHHAHAWPFEVISDPDPLGRAWLERILIEAN